MSVPVRSVAFMRSRQHIPADLAQRAPGPELAAELVGIDSALLTGFDAVQVLVARYRQLNHEQARYLELMAEVGRCDEPDSLVRCEPGEFAAEEARVALGLTRRRADDEFWFADDLVRRLSAVHAAMLAGNCDRPRAWIFCEWTQDVAPEQARAIVDRLLPRVVRGELTTGQLIEQLKRAAIAVDPDWARRRYERALSERKVIGTRNPDGTANLGGYNLPVERVAAAAEHIDHLAKSAKRAGSGRRLDHLRSELFLGMTDGAYTGLTDDDIIALLLATADDDTSDAAAQRSAAAAPAEAPAGEEPADSGEATSGGEATEQEPIAPIEQDEPTADAAERRLGGIELRAGVSTLLGHDQYPAELAGWGPLHAELARVLAGRLARGEWRWVVTDERGLLLDCGVTRTRPAGWMTGRRTRDVVELQIPEALLAELAGRDDLGTWAAVIVDLARQHAEQQDTKERFAGDAYRRHPGVAQRRWLQMRDRHCLGRGCRAPARSNQQDHTIDYALGGLTLDWNLGGLCGHEHRLKSEGGWRLTQPEPGHFRWTTRLGHTYDVPPRPITEPQQDPIPRGPDPYSLPLPPEGDWEKNKILEDPPPPEPEPPPPVSRDDPDDPPPF